MADCNEHAGAPQGSEFFGMIGLRRAPEDIAMSGLLGGHPAAKEMK